MKRSDFLKTVFLSGVGLTLSSYAKGKNNHKKPDDARGVLTLTGNEVSIFTKKQVDPTRIFHITDTHLSIDDARGEPYRQYSGRMAGAYQENPYLETGEMLSSAESFERTLELAKERKADFLALTGDIFSFPSEAAVEWAYQKLKATGIPFAYVSGNHDWHYEGLPGSSEALRDEWTKKRLKAMYQGNDPLCAAYDINGMRLVCIDDSTYEILPEQLDYLREQVKTGIPFILLIHIPLYMPGRSMGYGCANPDWGAKTDKNYEIERRQRWPQSGHSKVTMEFYDEVFKAPNLLAILAGHTHRLAMDVKDGISQIVAGANAYGNYLDVKVQSML